MSDNPTNQPGLLADWLMQLQPVLDFFGDTPYARALAIVVLALVVANLVAVIVTKVIGRLVQRTAIRWDDKLVSLLRGPLFWSVVLVGVLMASLSLKLAEKPEAMIHSAVATVLVLLWAAFVARLLRVIIQAMSERAQPQSLIRPQTRPLFENLAFILVLGGSIYFVFQSWDIDMTAWLASAGIAGIAIGFAAKDTLANLFSGVFILADGPYKIGDYVVLSSGERGKVTHIGIRSTRILTRDDVEITIPNAIMGNTQIINESGGPYEKFRIRVAVGVAYGSDIDKVKGILMAVARQEPEVCDDPEPRVRFRAFGTSSLDVELLCWVENPELRGRVLDSLNTSIYKRFHEEGVEIPYSKQDVYIKEMPKT